MSDLNLVFTFPSPVRDFMVVRNLVNSFSFTVLFFRPEGTEEQESEADSEEQVKCYLSKLKHFFLGNISDNKNFNCETDTYISKYIYIKTKNMLSVNCF